MRYYKVENRILFQNKEDGKVIGFGVKIPTYMKKYPYYKLAFKVDGEEAIIQSEEFIPEAVELTLEEAQSQVDDWNANYEDTLEDEVDENGEPTGQVLKKKLPPIQVATYDVNEIKGKMKVLYSKYGRKE